MDHKIRNRYGVLGGRLAPDRLSSTSDLLGVQGLTVRLPEYAENRRPVTDRRERKRSRVIGQDDRGGLAQHQWHLNASGGAVDTEPRFISTKDRQHGVSFVIEARQFSPHFIEPCPNARFIHLSNSLVRLDSAW
jgi:hypothetical protein